MPLLGFLALCLYAIGFPIVLFALTPKVTTPNKGKPTSTHQSPLVEDWWDLPKDWYSRRV